MNRTLAIIRNGRVELSDPVVWPDGTAVEIIPLPSTPAQVDWFALPPLDVGEFRAPTSEDDLLGEMLDDSRD